MAGVRPVARILFIQVTANTRTRALAAQAKRVDAVDEQIGAILSAAKAEPNGDWPPKPVRDVMERAKKSALDTGIARARSISAERS